jgi:hypothetical protein
MLIPYCCIKYTIIEYQTNSDKERERESEREGMGEL